MRANVTWKTVARCCWFAILTDFVEPTHLPLSDYQQGLQSDHMKHPTQHAHNTRLQSMKHADNSSSSAGLTMFQVVHLNQGLWTRGPHNFTEIIFIRTKYIKKLRQFTDQYTHLEICIKQKPQFLFGFLLKYICFKISPILISFC